MALIGELKRRNVFRVGAAYAVGSWLLLQVIDVVGPILRLPDSVARYALFLLIVGLLPALVFAWAFEWTPEGVRLDREHTAAERRSRSHKLDKVIMVGLALAVALLLFDRFKTAGNDADDKLVASREGTPAPVRSDSAIVAPRRKSVAVLPFVPMSNGPDDDYFADGLTEEVINALGQAPDLLVTARTSAFHYRNSALTIGDIARELGVAHIVEGSVRRAGDQLRMSAKLVRAADGFQLWSETFDRDSGDDFTLQSDIAEKVAQALDVLLDDELRQRMRLVGTGNVDAFIAFQKGVELYERAHREPNRISLLRQANIQFERAIAEAQDLYPAYDYHADLYVHMVTDHAAGQLDGEVTDADLSAAPTALRQDYDQAIRRARTSQERQVARFARALILGPWRGLSSLSELAGGTEGCESQGWLVLVGAAFGRAEESLRVLRRTAACDPLRVTPRAQMARIYLWLGRPADAISLAAEILEQADFPSVQRTLSMGQALKGDTVAAERTAETIIRDEENLHLVMALVTAIGGDAARSARYQQAYLGAHGPEDSWSLVLAALRGNRNEANRLAGMIDRRPFGYVVLLDSVDSCVCGAPFDLEATPNFASMLAESGLQWPPGTSYRLPLKDW